MMREHGALGQPGRSTRILQDRNGFLRVDFEFRRVRFSFIHQVNELLCPCDFGGLSHGIRNVIEHIGYDNIPKAGSILYFVYDRVFW